MTPEDMEKMRQVEEARLKKGFIQRNRVLAVGFAGLVGLHLLWYRLVETYVPEGEKSTHFPFPLLRKLDALIIGEPKK